MTDFDDFKIFEKDGWEERASTYGNWAVTSQIVPVAVEALDLASDDNVLEKLAKQDLVTKSLVRGSFNKVLSYHQST